MLTTIISIYLQITPAAEAWHTSAYHTPQRFNQERILQRMVQKSTSLWNGHFSANHYHSSEEKNQLNNIKSTLRTTIKSLPASHTHALKNLEVNNHQHASRGLANSYKVILNTASIKTNQELQAVFTHELGHIVDLGKIKGYRGRPTEFRDGKRPVLSDDPSVEFYRLSWKNAQQKKTGTRNTDFVSGYAKSSPFEDFAESYIFYRLHGEKFRAQAQKSSVLHAKYQFLKTRVFNNLEFQTRKPPVALAKQPWDTTLLPY